MTKNELIFDYMYNYPIREKITPYKVAIYLLINEMEKFFSSEPMTHSEHLYLANLINALIQQPNFSYPGLEAFLFKYVRWYELMAGFLQKVHSYGTTREPIVRLDLTFQKKSNKDAFVYSQSVIGVFIRKLYLQYQLCSESERNKFYCEWSEYINGESSNAERYVLKNQWNVILTDESKENTMIE